MSHALTKLVTYKARSCLESNLPLFAFLSFKVTLVWGISKENMAKMFASISRCVTCMNQIYSYLKGQCQFKRSVSCACLGSDVALVRGISKFFGTNVCFKWTVCQVPMRRCNTYQYMIQVGRTKANFIS